MSFKHTVVMPKMSMTMESGELIGFHVIEGQEVQAGAVLFEVMTDKIDMEVEAPADGKIEKLLAAPGAVLEVGKPVLIMETTTQVLSFDFDSPSIATTAPIVEVQPAQSVLPNESFSTHPKSVPAARKLAEDKGLNLQNITATGPFQTITYQDVLNANTDPKIAARQAANRALIAKGIELTLSIPQTSFTRSISKSSGIGHRWHAELISKWAKTLRNFGATEIGVAIIIESKYGSALPVFKNPDLVELESLENLVMATTEQAKNGKVPLEMLNGATTTIFDLTSYQMSSDRPVLFPNQSTGLTVGIDRDGKLSLSLSIDLRALDFYDGAILLERLVNAL